MKRFSEDEIELLLQGLGILRDIYEEIVGEGCPDEGASSSAHHIASLRLARTRDLIAKCRALSAKSG